MAKALALVLALAMFPAAASALTLEDVVALAKAGVTDEVLVALIDRDRDVYHIEASELMTLKNAGVSQAVVLALLRSGRQQQPPAAVTLAAPPAPDLLIVGHGPDRPNTAHKYSGFVEPTAPPIVDGAFAVPPLLFIPPSIVASRCAAAAVPFDPTAPPSARGIFFNNPEASRGIFFRVKKSP